MDGMEREKVWHVRIAVAAALVGCAGVVSGLRHELGLGWAVGLLTACLLGVVLALRDVHHRVDQEKARRTVFYAGEGSAALFVLLTVGLSVVPAWVIGALPDPALQSPAAAVLAAAVAAMLAITGSPRARVRGPGRGR